MSNIFILFLSTMYIFIGVKSADTWIPYSSTLEYLFKTECIRWNEASTTGCDDVNGELASAQTEAQRNFIVNTVYDGSSASGCTGWPGGGNGVWMGATQSSSTVYWFDGTTTGFYDPANPIDWDTDAKEPDYVSSQTVIGFSTY